MPGPHFFRAHVTAQLRLKYAYNVLHLQHQGLSKELPVLAADGSFKVTKVVRDRNGNRIIGCIYTVMAGDGRVVHSAFLPNEENQQLRGVLETVAKQIEALGDRVEVCFQELPKLMSLIFVFRLHSLINFSCTIFKVVYTDNCCKQRALMESVFSQHFERAEPTLHVARNKQTTFDFGHLRRTGRYLPALNYVSMKETADALVSSLHTELLSLPAGPRVLGLDMEWSPGAADWEIGFIQLATQAKVLVIQVSGWNRSLPAAFGSLLLDVSICKVGNNIFGDKTRLSKWWVSGSLPSGPAPDWINLAQEAKAIGLVSRAQISLDALVQQLLSLKLEKPPSLRKAAWSSPKLKPTDEMVSYAALDAIASLDVYFELQRRKSFAVGQELVLMDKPMRVVIADVTVLRALDTDNTIQVSVNAIRVPGSSAINHASHQPE